MGKLPPEEKKRVGQSLNAAKQKLEEAYDARKRKFESDALNLRLDAEWLDLTLPAPPPRRGHLHPITRIQRELEDLFVSLGFTVLDGPEVETEYHNFDALNIPPDHPARDMQDTFWLDGGNPLHYAAVQVRGMSAGRAAHDRARRVFRKRGRYQALSPEGTDGGSRRQRGAPDLFYEDAAHGDLPPRSHGAVAPGSLVRRTC
jgi:phenylalanyl-tRNA synthetase alpha subunit